MLVSNFEFKKECLVFKFILDRNNEIEDSLEKPAQEVESFSMVAKSLKIL